MTIAAETLKQLLLSYIAIGKSSYSDNQLAALYNESLPRYLGLAGEAIPVEALIDKSLVKHALDSLIAANSPEETLMFSFMLYIYTLMKSGQVHPLEMGIVRQKINGLMPVFEKAMEQDSIRAEVFESNSSLLSAIAEQTENAQEAIAVLAKGYAKYA